MNTRKLARAVNLLVVFSMLLNVLAPAIPVLALPMQRPQAEADFVSMEAKKEAPNQTIPVAGNFAPPVFRDPQAPEDTLTPTPTPAGIDTEPASPTFTITETPTPLPSDTETPEPSASDTPSPTSTATETETSTPTGTATGSETPTATSTPTPVVGVDLSLSARPAMVKKDGSLTIEWRVKGIEIESRPDPRYVLKIMVPQGFAFAPRALAMAAEMGLEGAVFDPETGVLTIQLRAAEGRIEWRVDDAVTGPYDIRAELIDRDAAATTVSAAVMTVQDGRYDKVGRGGGVVRSGDDRVRVEFGGQTADGDVRLRIKPLDYREGGIRPLGGHAFEVLAVDDAFFGEFENQPSTDSRKPDREKNNRRPDFLHAFRREFSIEVRYSEVGLGGGEAGLILYYYNEQLGIWLPLPTTVDTENNILRARTDHLTVFDYKAQNFEAARLPDMKAWQVSSFTGSASYSLPLWTPPGPGGLQPSLSLSYNSQGVDGASGTSQASWVGLGWNLDAGGTIIRDTHGTTDFTGDDSFSLSVAGVGGMLLPGNDGYMHTADETFWRIQYNETDDSWTAWDKTGNVYTFATRAKTPLYSGCSAPTLRTWQWSLTSMKNIYGKELTYTYEIESKTVKDACGGNAATLDLAVMPKYVTYPHSLYRVEFSTAADRQDYRYEWTQESSRMPFKKRYLIEVRITRNENNNFGTLMRKYVFSYESDPANRIFPGVEWPYNCTSTGCAVYKGMLTLVKVQEFGTDGATSLPAATFGYADGRLDWAENGYGGRVEFEYDAWHDIVGAAPVEMRCEAVNPDVDDHTNFDGWTNGLCDNQSASGRFYIYGGQNLSVNTTLMNNFTPGTVYRIEATAFGAGSGSSLAVGFNDGNNDTLYSSTYDTLPTSGEPQAITFDFTLPNDARQLHLYLSGQNWSLTSYKITPLLTRYRVVEKSLIDGIGQTLDEVYQYEYVGAASNDPAHSDDAANNPRATSYSMARGEFRGHSQVTEIGPNGSRSVTVYSQKDDISGRVLESWIEDYTGKVYSRSLTGYAAITASSGMEFSPTNPDGSVNSGLAEPVLQVNTNHFMFPHKIDGTLYTDLARVWVITQWEESRTCVATDPTCNSQYAATKKEYWYLKSDQGNVQYGNQTKVVESYWNGSIFIPLRWTRQLSFVSSDPSIYLPGLISAIATRICATSECNNLDTASLISQTLIIYDGASSHTTPPTVGRLTAKRTYIEYSENQQRYVDERYAYDGWGNLIASTTYSDSGTSSQFATGGAQTTSTTFDDDFHTFALMSTNALGQNTTFIYDYTLAAPRTQTDPNGAVTTVYYDALGRLVRVDRPGDTYFLTVTYFDSARPYWMAVSQKIDADRRYDMRKIYDGLGRLIQTQAVRAEVNGYFVDILSDSKTTNLAAGSQSFQSIPYVVDPWNGIDNGNPYKPPSWNWAKSYTVNDILGRTLESYGTDGQKASETEYNYEFDTVSLGPKTRTIDAKLRTTISITDAWGRTVLVIAPDGPDIQYTYNEAGQLVTVVTGGNTTQITYDKGGRKKSLDDPDMGAWDYDYDALGNLIQQTDQRGCTTTMVYDQLNRLTQKLFTGALLECYNTPGVTYAFDSTVGGNAGIGRRTGMSDGSGSTAWKFDIRGRLVEELKTISGGGTFRTGYGYNAADLPVYTVYPGGSNGEPGERVDQSYNNQMTLESVRSNTYNFPYLQSVSYDASGRILRRVLGQDSANSKAIENTFTYYDWTTQNMAGKLERALYVGDFTGTPTVLLQDLRYTYDETGNVLTIADYASEPGTVQTQTYTYDLLDRLLTANVAGGVNGLYSETYTYNAQTGNLESKGGVTYTYGDAEHVHGVTGLSNGDSFTYDDAGNQILRMVSGDTFMLTYNAEGRLIRVTKNGLLQAEYLYDGEGKLARTVEDGKTTIIISGLAEMEMGGAPAATAVPSATFTPSGTNTPTASNTPLPIPGTGLTGSYFDNIDSTGLALVRVDPNISFNWGSGAPAATMGVDTFTVWWNGYIMPRYTEAYTLYLMVDDNATLWIDNNVVLSASCCSEQSTIVNLQAGVKHSIQIAFAENTGNASASLAWSSLHQTKEVVPQSRLYPLQMPTPIPPAAGVGLTGEYFAANYFVNRKIVRIDPKIDFSWASGSPDTSIPADNFSVRWTGYVIPRFSQDYTFFTNADNGAQVFINDVLNVNGWSVSGETAGTPISLVAGQRYKINMQFFEATGSATAKLSWSSASQVKEIIPQTQLYPSDAPDNFFNQWFGGTRNNADGWIGYEFIPSEDLIVNALGRSVSTTMAQNHEVKIWRASDWSVMVSATILPSSPLEYSGYRYVRLASPVVLKKGVAYRIASFEYSGGDAWLDNRAAPDHKGWAAITRSLYGGTLPDVSWVVGEYAAGMATFFGGPAGGSVTGTPTTIPTFIPTSSPTPSGSGLRAEYFGNTNFTDLRATRTDGTVNFNFYTYGPIAGVGEDNFSIRWTGYVLPQYTDTYTFYVWHDDGARLWVNNQLIVDNWNTSAGVENSGTILLQAGRPYSIRLEYYEATQSASVRLYWSCGSQTKQIIPQNRLTPASGGETPPVGNGNGLTAEYFLNPNLTWLKVVQTDPAINFNWYTYGPVAGIGEDNFSVRWTGYVQPKYSETYTFYLYHDDGVRLWVDNQLLIDQWVTATGVEHSGTITLAAGQKYPIRVEYYEATQSASVKLYWSSNTQTKEIVPQSQLYSASPAPTATGTPANGGGLTGQYFGAANLTNLVSTRTDGTVNFNFYTYGPIAGIGEDNFSIRWTGFVLPRYTDTYTFYVWHDDGARLWVNNQLIVDNWNTSAGVEHSGMIALQGGTKYSIKLEYYEATQSASVRLYWSSNIQPKEIIPQSQLFPAVQTPTPTATATATATASPTHTATRTNTQTPTSIAPVPEGQTWTFYYYAGGQRIAMRKVTSGGTPTNTLQYILGDHLGSTSVIADVNGQRGPEVRYKAFGETRYASGPTGTKYQYTGQRNESGIGLYYYNARWYDAKVGRFAQADSVIPTQNPIGWDRFAYTGNNPIKYSDPSGHGHCDNLPGAARQNCEMAYLDEYVDFSSIISFYGKSWTERNIRAIKTAVYLVGNALASAMSSVISSTDAFKKIYGSVEFEWGTSHASGQCSNIKDGGCTSGVHRINFMSISGNFQRAVNTAIHELGHAFASRWKSSIQDPNSPTGFSRNPENPYNILGGNEYSDLRSEDGWPVSIPRSSYESERLRPGEVFADMFVDWTRNTWGEGYTGERRRDFMTTNMTAWLAEIRRYY